LAKIEVDDLQFPEMAALILGKDRSCLEELKNYCNNQWMDDEGLDRDIAVQHFQLSRMLNMSRGTVGSTLVFQAFLKMNFVLDRQSCFLFVYQPCSQFSQARLDCVVDN
jgi:hypothetical protein